MSNYSAGERSTLLHYLERAVQNHGDTVFIDILGETRTFRQVDRDATKLAHELAKLGIAHGDTVVTITETHHDTVTLWFGILKLGAIWVPINLAYRHEFLRHQITDSGARVVICDANFLERVTEIIAKLPDVKKIICRDEKANFPECSVPIEPFDDYRGSDETPIPINVKPSDLGGLIYTSGTTGPSKGCMVSHNYMCMQGRQQIRALALDHDSVSFTPLPLFHSSAQNCVLGALALGGPIAIWPRFSVSTFWNEIERSGATHSILMASIFPLVANAPDCDAAKRCYGQLQMISGVPISPEVRELWKKRFGVKIVSSWAYGQTEASRMCMVLPDETPPEASAGRPADEFDVMIFDDNDCPMPPGTIGQIACRPKFPNVMFEGYWKQPAETAKAWRNFWMHTGDLGKMDEQGYMYFADRAKDYLRSRGENISSFEVERTFMNHPEVAEVAVHAVGAQTGEDEIKVTLVCHPGASINEETLCHWSIANLPHFAVPRYYEFRSELIKNPTGRVLKYRLRDEGVTTTTWDREAAGIQVRRRR